MNNTNGYEEIKCKIGESEENEMKYSLRDLQKITGSELLMIKKDTNNYFYFYPDLVLDEDMGKLKLISIWMDDLELEVEYDEGFWDKYTTHPDATSVHKYSNPACPIEYLLPRK